MKNKSKIIIGFGIILFGFIIWNYGLFYRYNYLTAKIDIIKGNPNKVTCVFKYGRGSRAIEKKLDKKYGYSSVNFGCFIEGKKKKGIVMYNAEVENYLIKRNGVNWKLKYQIEKDSLLKISSIPRTAFWIEKNGEGNWYNIDWMHNHKNNAKISIYDKYGDLVTKGHFMIICPNDEFELMEELEMQIDFYDDKNIQLKSNCFLMKRK